MSRYSSYGQTDAPPLEEADLNFVGVNSYNAPDDLQPGQAQAAVNIDFSTENAGTRGGFVCLPSLATSGLGMIWIARTSTADLDWDGVTYGNGLFVAVASNGTGNGVMTSPDGITWTSRVPSADYSWKSIAFGIGIFVAVSSNGASDRVMTSGDGITWVSQTAAASNAWNSVVYGSDRFVAVASTGTDRVMWSTDGSSWNSASAAAANSWQSVTYGNGQFVAVSSAGVMTSPNGVTWTSRSAAAANSWRSVVFGNGLYVAVSTDGGTTQVMTSTDGITWTLRTTPANNQWRSVTYGAGFFVAVAGSGTGNRVMVSRDGITWTSRSSAADNDWFAVTFANERFVAVASNTGTGNRVMTTRTTVFASGLYSDPNDPGSVWIVVVGSNTVGFYAFGRTARTVAIDSPYEVAEQSTIVQCNNLVYIFRGTSSTPLYWTGSWSTTFTVAPTPTPAAGFEIIPNSNQATYYQNRLWVKNGKDTESASDVLDFTRYDQVANSFNINKGDSDFIVTSFPFGTTTLVVFKNKSIIALTSVQGVLSAVVATEITRQVGAIGINSVCSVGSDLVYMSDRNVNLLSLTDTNNALQHQTKPLSTNIQSIMKRVNWNYAYKVSMAYWDNKLFVALPLDNAIACNAVVVHNFINGQWFGEWNFASSLGLTIQGWVVADYLGATRLHCISEDGRIFVTGEGQNDISGTIVGEISTSLTTRAYKLDDTDHIPRRIYADLETNRPSYSITAYADGASESTIELSAQTYLRSQSWLFADSTYNMDNSSDDYNRAFRKDYATGPNSIQSGSGFQPEMVQAFRIPLITRRKGRVSWFKVENTTGYMSVNGIGVEVREGDRGMLTQVG